MAQDDDNVEIPAGGDDDVVVVATATFDVADAPAVTTTTTIPHDANNTVGDEFRDFVAHNETRTCSADKHSKPFNQQIRGVNLGGWMVLEPWITPSLFYQFLDTPEKKTAFDIYTFCEVLGPAEANKQLRRHWDAWVTKGIIEELAASGAVNSLRLPVGDFMYIPYGPYHGCVDGSLEYVDKLLDWAQEAGLSVLLDIHALKDSQNGFDNSGQTMGFSWTSALTLEFGGLTTFQHWPVRDARWIGTFDPNKASYSDINYGNIRHALDVIQIMVDRYKNHPAVLGLEPVNEPWQYTPIEELKQFYWEGYLIVKRDAPEWKYVMHDSFRLDPNVWGGFMAGCPDRALDTHIYQAWRDPDSRIGFYRDACSKKSIIATLEREFGPVVVGEWSLATDNCAMWLNGFNDNLPGFPRLPCKYIPCADPYMGTEQPGTPVDPSKPIQGPYGTGMSGPIFGLCPVTRDWMKEMSGNPLTGRDWVRAPPKVPWHLDDTDDVMKRLAAKKIDAFSGVGHGFYFWNFRTDIDEPHWSYMLALERGWIPRGELNTPNIRNACRREDDGEYRCVVKRNQLDSSVKHAISYALNVQNQSDTEFAETVLDKTGTDLMHAGSEVLNDFFQRYRHSGATCDFGGVAMLVQMNVTLADDDAFGLDDDEYYRIYIHEGPDVWVIVVLVVVGTLLGSVIGFVVAMRTSKSFNRRVRKSVFFRPISSTNISVLRKSLRLESFDPEYDEIQELKTADNVGYGLN